MISITHTNREAGAMLTIYAHACCRCHRGYIFRRKRCEQGVFNSLVYVNVIPDSKVHGANMGPILGRQDPGGPHVGPMNLAIWDSNVISLSFRRRTGVRICIKPYIRSTWAPQPTINSALVKTRAWAEIYKSAVTLVKEALLELPEDTRDRPRTVEALV